MILPHSLSSTINSIITNMSFSLPVTPEPDYAQLSTIMTPPLSPWTPTASAELAFSSANVSPLRRSLFGSSTEQQQAASPPLSPWKDEGSVTGSSSDDSLTESSPTLKQNFDYDAGFDCDNDIFRPRGPVKDSSLGNLSFSNLSASFQASVSSNSPTRSVMLSWNEEPSPPDGSRCSNSLQYLSPKIVVSGFCGDFDAWFSPSISSSHSISTWEDEESSMDGWESFLEPKRLIFDDLDTLPSFHAPMVSPQSISRQSTQSAMVSSPSVSPWASQSSPPENLPTIRGSVPYNWGDDESFCDTVDSSGVPAEIQIRRGIRFRLWQRPFWPVSFLKKACGCKISR